jgi:ubiquinone biosynthesis monooxygenase Coq7
MIRRYSFVDKLICHVDVAMSTLLAKPTQGERDNPASTIQEANLSEQERKHVAGLMRVNHVGEVCAQALYQGQALTARSPEIAEKMQEAANEELDHLAWCMARIKELDSHPSRLNLLWYTGALSMGLVAGALGDKWSLGFLAETEQQVVNHLESHFDQLPRDDKKSYAVISQMRDDEAKHRDMANEEGAAPLPVGIKKLMGLCSKVMTKVAYWV